MIETLSLDDFEKSTDNIYEAIIVLAKRARQINNDQKQILNQESEEEEDYESYTEEEFEASMENREFIRLPKPSVIALEEFLAGKVGFEYIDPSGDDEQGPQTS